MLGLGHPVAAGAKVDFKAAKELFSLGDSFAVGEFRLFWLLIAFDLIGVEYPVISRHGDAL